AGVRKVHWISMLGTAPLRIASQPLSAAKDLRLRSFAVPSLRSGRLKMTDLRLPLDRAAERARGLVRHRLAAEQDVERVGEAGGPPLLGLRAVVDVAAIAQRAAAVDDVDVRRDARAVRVRDCAVAVLEIRERI